MNSVWHRRAVVVAFVVDAFDCIAVELEAFQSGTQILEVALTSVEVEAQVEHWNSSICVKHCLFYDNKMLLSPASTMMILGSWWTLRNILI